MEITIQERPMNALDGEDATRTLEAAMAHEDAHLAGTAPFVGIDQVWLDKAADIAPDNTDEIALFVLDAPEFQPLVDAARANPDYGLEHLSNGYWKITAQDALVFERKKLGFVPALWNAALTGGFVGQVTEFDRYRLQISRGAQ
jgi:hypothetical protein